MTNGKVITGLLMLTLILGILPLHSANAGEATVSHDPAYVDPVSIDIWGDDMSIYVRHNGVQQQLGVDSPITDNQIIRDYVVTVETYQDIDGELVTVIYFNIMFFISEHDFAFKGETADSGSVYHDIYFGDVARGCNAWNPTIYYVAIKGSEMSEIVKARVVHGTGGFTAAHEGTIYADDRFAERSGRIYVTPFTQGRYKIYCSRPVRNGLDGDILYPATPLPGTSSAGGSDFTYRTVIRIFDDLQYAGNETCYDCGNAYYDGAVKANVYGVGSNNDETLGNSKIVNYLLSGGTETHDRTKVQYPLCTLDTYGEFWDLAYTNDPFLLGALKLPQNTFEKYYYSWDALNKKWVTKSISDSEEAPPHSSAGSHFGGSHSSVDSENTTFSATLGSLSGLSAMYSGSDELVSASVFNDIYPDYKQGFTTILIPTKGITLHWNYSGGSVTNPYVRIVCDAEVQVDVDTVRTYRLYVKDLDTEKRLSALSGSYTIPVAPIISAYGEAYSELKRQFNKTAKSLKWTLTPYAIGADGKYSYGKSVSVSHTYTAVKTNASDNDVFHVFDWSIGNTSVGSWVKNVISNVEKAVGLLGNLLTKGMALFSKLGQIPAMLASVVPFIPEELWTILSIGILLYFAPAIVRGIRNLIIGGFK